MHNTVLIVDDVEMNREILAEMLQDEYKIIMADSGEKALEILEEKHEEIAIMLLDLVMPGMDGFQVLQQVREKPWSSHLAIIIISCENTNKTERQCFDLGVSDFIHRPFDDVLVKQRVNNVVSLYQYQAGLENKIEEQTLTLKNSSGFFKYRQNN